MLCVDGAEIEVLTLALGTRERDTFVVHVQETLPRRLGNELGVIEEFLLKQNMVLGSMRAFGVVRGPGSAGALRGVLSFIDAWAIASNKDVFSVVREGELWKIEGSAKPYVLPVYNRPAHVTPSSKDALRRKL